MSGIQGENTPLLSAIVRFNLEHRKADMLGRFAGGKFTHYATMGGRLGARDTPKSVRSIGALTNAGIAGYGAAVKALNEGHDSLDSKRILLQPGESQFEWALQMNKFLKWLVSVNRETLAYAVNQAWGLLVFIAASLSWHYFSSIYAAIPVLVVGLAIGGYLWGLIEGKQVDDQQKDNQRRD